MKRILIINGHPDKESYNFALAKAYIEGVEKNEAIVEQINIVNLNFNINLKNGYQKRTDLEPDLLDAIEKIKNSDHIVWFYPMWWSSMPAIMKGFIDRVFLPGITFQPLENSIFYKKLLKGKSSRIIITADSPRFYDIIFMKQPALRQFKKGTLEFCGINPVKVTYIAPIKSSSLKFREKWLQKVKKLGEQMK